MTTEEQDPWGEETGVNGCLERESLERMQRGERQQTRSIRRSVRAEECML